MAFVRLGAFDAVDALCDGGVCTRYISKSHIVPASHKKILINVGKSYNCGHTRYSTINLWIKKELLSEKLLHVFFSAIILILVMFRIYMEEMDRISG